MIKEKYIENFPKVIDTLHLFGNPETKTREIKSFRRNCCKVKCFSQGKLAKSKMLKTRNFIFKGVFGTVMVKCYTNMRITLIAKTLLYN